MTLGVLIMTYQYCSRSTFWATYGEGVGSGDIRTNVLNSKWHVCFTSDHQTSCSLFKFRWHVIGCRLLNLVNTFPSLKFTSLQIIVKIFDQIYKFSFNFTSLLSILQVFFFNFASFFSILQVFDQFHNLTIMFISLRKNVQVYDNTYIFRMKFTSLQFLQVYNTI